MPIYMYECLDCLGEWKVSHSMTENIDDCEWCYSKNIHRKPAPFSNLTKKRKQQRKIGDLTKEYIENSKQDLKTQRQELDNQR